ncbi:MAG TPA: sulfotransferase [Verrucomicrobiae bacterium]|nr:sulfotransferase [Verrucomicrobiae bacterium]
MKLAPAFVKLPLRFDAQRLAHEVAALPSEAWTRHPQGFSGNSAVRLISVAGGENDRVAGAMATTPHLTACPYLRQVLGSFGVVWSRSRLMKLAPGAKVPEHADINYHWFSRVRIHVPVQTERGVLFHCGSDVVHMAAGEAWIFDNWRLHRVENGSPRERVHLVADTVGSAPFWKMVEAGMLDRPARAVPFDSGHSAPLLLERYNVPRVMSPAELEQLMGDLSQELSDRTAPDGVATPAIQQFRALLVEFCQDWRQLWLLYADAPEGMPAYQAALSTLRTRATPLAKVLRMRTNRLGAMMVLQARIRYAAGDAEATAEPEDEYDAHSSARRVAPRLERPVFIVSAPRSGSTLLFETLACTPQVWTVGGEAHWLVEGFPELCPGAPGIDSNRVEARHATPDIADAVRRRIIERLQGSAREPLPTSLTSPLRFLEKTPKNSLRIPFFNAVFPDALFVFLWREPRANISSIMEAWKSNRWVTYRQLEGWDGPWSMLLPPGWRRMRAKPLEEIAAFQWRTANQIIADDLAALRPGRSLMVSYEDFLGDPAVEVRRICDFAGWTFDDALRQRVAGPLPLSRYTQTQPQPEKWRKNHDAIERVLPSLDETWMRLRDLQSSKP